MSGRYGSSGSYWEDYASTDMPHSQRSRPLQNVQHPPRRAAPDQQPVVYSPPRKPIATHTSAVVPAPPQHQSPPPSPPKHRFHASGVIPPEVVSYSPAHSRASQALRDIDNLYAARIMPPSPEPEGPSYTPTSFPRRPLHKYTDSQSSITPLRQGAAAIAVDHSSPSPSRRAPPASIVDGYGYQYDQNMRPAHSSQMNSYEAYMDPQGIANDAEDDFVNGPSFRRHVFGNSALGANTSSSATEILKAYGTRDSSGSYGKIPGGGRHGDNEKSAWLESQTGRSTRLKYVFGAVGIFIVCAIVAGVVAGVIVSNPGGDKSGKTTSTQAPSDPTGEYTLHSPEVQAVLGNQDLHKVFPGIDYTPLNAQYPACLQVPPNQDNITLDVAVLSQLSPAIRLYGNDCNQTQMLLTAIERLEMEDTVKVWLGVWLENNSTTNTRQLNQMYDILDQYPADRFIGVIVGNEVLFREDMTAAQLGDILITVRKNLNAKGIDLPVSTSDIGSAWTSTIAADSDIVMANVHPFFAGVKPDVAASWTWDFWQNDDVVLAENHYANFPKSIISETGWPSQGGNDCGTGEKCPTTTDGAIASISGMNTFMDGWVCQGLDNGTTYFWFEAFDQPWAASFDDPATGDFWEPHWGLMDVNRNLKPGVKIPDCGGKTVNKAY